MTRKSSTVSVSSGVLVLVTVFCTPATILAWAAMGSDVNADIGTTGDKVSTPLALTRATTTERAPSLALVSAVTSSPMYNRCNGSSQHRRHVASMVPGALRPVVELK